MQNRNFYSLRRKIVIGLIASASMVTLEFFVKQAHAIPSFSRKYRTSCITCHTVFPKLNDTGEAFRRNGYQFPSGEELLVKDEPVPLGSDRYKDMFPNSIWPSDMPTLPPVFIRTQLRNIVNTDPGPDGIRWDQDFPHEVVLGGAGTFGQDISAWWEIEFNPSEDEAGVERAFVQFSNLFAWSDEEDDDGMRTGNRWITLPKHALNLRVGRMEPQVLGSVFSVHRRVSITSPLPNKQRFGNNPFRFEPAQSAVELHGILQQHWSYLVGYANGGSSGRLDDNTHKDVYFRVSRKWFGFPLDGVVGQSEPLDENEDIRGQSPDEDDDSETAPAGLNHWRSIGFETGVFGWWGKSEIPFMAGIRGDSFRRIGFDARLQWQDLDIYGLVYWGHDNFAGLVGGANLGGEDHASYLIQADYMFKPWMLGFLRFEQTDFNETARTSQEQGRVIPGMVFLIRQNMKLQMEYVLDTTGKDTGGPQATDSLLFQLDYAF